LALNIAAVETYYPIPDNDDNISVEKPVIRWMRI